MTGGGTGEVAGADALDVRRGIVEVDQFRFECGRRLPVELAYETYGDPADEAILLCHALTGSAHVATAPDPGDLPWDPPRVPAEGQAAAWWADLVGPGETIDTDEHFVVCVNVPGSCYGSTGPASEGPDGEPYGSDFPAVTVGDWTRAQRAVLDDLGVDRLRAVVGGSVGGMNVLEWVRRFPDRVELAVPVATAARLDARSLALDAVRRRAIRGDPAWNGGDYYGGPGPRQGLALARQLGHVMYRSPGSMERQFGRRTADEAAPTEAVEQARNLFPGGDEPYLAIESYLDYNGARFVDRFDANSYLALTGAMAAYDLAAEAGSVAAALSDFAGEALLVSFSDDWHFPVGAVRELAGAFRRASATVDHRVVDSGYGHDAFLADPETVGRPLAAALADADSRVTADHAPVHSSLIGD